MDNFLKTSAVLCGAANELAVCMIGSSEGLLGDFADSLPWSYAVLFSLLAGSAGLFVAQIRLRLARPNLVGKLFLRYTSIVLAVSVGGALSAFSVGATNLLSVSPAAGGGAISLLSVLPSLFVFGGLLGLVEGIVTAIPLAVMLRRLVGQSQPLNVSQHA